MNSTIQWVSSIWSSHKSMSYDEHKLIKREFLIEKERRENISASKSRWWTENISDVYPEEKKIDCCSEFRYIERFAFSLRKARWFSPHKTPCFHCQVEPQFLYLPMDFYMAGLTIVKVPKQCGATNLYAKMKISFKESPLAHKPKNVCSRLAMNLWLLFLL